MDKQTAMKKLAHAAQRIFEEEKNTILEDLTERLNEIEAAESEDEIEALVREYLEEERECEGITLVNPGGVDLAEDDYRAVTVVYKDGEEKNPGHVTVGFYGDDECSIRTLFALQRACMNMTLHIFASEIEEYDGLRDTIISIMEDRIEKETVDVAMEVFKSLTLKN